MKPVFSIVFQCALVMGIAIAAPEQELPSWKNGKPDAAEPVAGSVLLTEDPVPDESGDNGVLELPAAPFCSLARILLAIIMANIIAGDSIRAMAAAICPP